MFVRLMQEKNNSEEDKSAVCSALFFCVLIQNARCKNASRGCKWPVRTDWRGSMEQESRKKKQKELFLVFLKIGGFTFGGGYAMIPLIQKELCDKKKWISKDDILDIVAIAESTPGPIAVNAATFVGKKVAGFWGAFFATFGVVLPSFLIICILSKVLNQVGQFSFVKYMFFGLRAGVIALIVNAFWNIFKQCPKELFTYLVASLAFCLVVFTKIDVVWVILGCACLGVFSYFAVKRRMKA